MVKKFYIITVNFNSMFGIDNDDLDEIDFKDWSDYGDKQVEVVNKMSQVLVILRPDYYIYSFEVGSTGNLHMHCYFEFKKGFSMAFIKATFTRYGLPAPHIQSRYGTKDQAIQYIKKDLQFIEDGVVVDEGEEISRRKQAINYIKEHSYHELVSEDLELAALVPYGVAMKYDRDNEVASRKEDPPVVCHWYYGDPGTGKSFRAENWITNNGAEKCIFIQGSKKFAVQYIPNCWNYYMDNLTFVHYNELESFLGIAERNMFIFEVKGESHFVHCSKLAVTSVFPPADLFASLTVNERRNHTLEEVLRRISHLYRCYKDDNGEFLYEEEEDKEVTVRPNLDLNNI
jgi:hypothetical protein